jgi:hypothetical protein
MQTTITRADGLTFHGPDMVLSRHDLLPADRLWCCRGIGYLLAVFRDRDADTDRGEFRALIGFIATDNLAPAFESAREFMTKVGAVATVQADGSLVGGA